MWIKYIRKIRISLATVIIEISMKIKMTTMMELTRNGINKYDRVETKNHANKNDKHCTC